MTATTERLAELLQQAPGWARIGLTAPNPRIRGEATLELADYLAHGLDRPAPARDTAQLALPL